MLRYLFLITLLLSQLTAFSQLLPIHIHPVSGYEAPALQSFAWAEHSGKVLLFGGRVDGLHQRQPFASMDAAGRPDSLWLLDIPAHQTWRMAITQLPANVREQFQSTNPQFIQVDHSLILIGGYGYSETDQDHITHPQLTVIDLPALFQAMEQQSDPASAISTVIDQRMAITGGRMARFNDTLMLVGGHRFDGRYNPMNGPSFVQTYSNSVRRFRLGSSSGIPQILDYQEIVDTASFHRRDYNLVPQILPNGESAYTIYSGVFRTDMDLPWTNAITLKPGSTTEEPNFVQYFNHYQCAVLPLWDAATQTMHSVFFGGMAQYYRDSSGQMIQDTNVPFVDAITDVIRQSDGTLVEQPMPIRMNGLKGAGTEFIPASGLVVNAYGVMHRPEGSDSVLLGWLVGGIVSTAPNIFWVNDGTQSTADYRLQEVWYVPDAALNLPVFKQSFNLRAYPCPVNDHVFVELQLEQAGDVYLELRNAQGKKVASKLFRNHKAGAFLEELEFRRELSNGVYFLEVETLGQKSALKILVTD